MYFTNMKIAVTADQPLDEVIKTLESKGSHLSKRQSIENAKNITFIGVFNGWFEMFRIPHNIWDGELTTIAELKEMRNG